ncbi:MAG: hypothetical protein QF638_02045 [Acidimicrobiales bacterium]|jgi:hypothetical protein|nr:hypothetical protein [Acidimicrobiales bacterium]
MAEVSKGVVSRGQQAGYPNQATVNVAVNTLGEQIVMDWIQKAVMDGMMYQVRAGTISVPLVGDVVLTDTAAEMAADVASGTSILPVSLNIAVNLGTGTLHEYAAKSVATVSSSGTAFTPLPVRTDGPAAVSSARVQAAGSVTVTAETATTTMVHWHGANPLAVVTAGGGFQGVHYVQLIPAPLLTGARSFYMQIAATGTGPSYFANFNYVEVASALVER